MDAIQIQMLSERLGVVREQACDMFNLRHPVRYDDIAYRLYSYQRMTELLEQAKSLPPHEIGNLVMQYTSDLLAHKPQVKEASNG